MRYFTRLELLANIKHGSLSQQSTTYASHMPIHFFTKQATLMRRSTVLNLPLPPINIPWLG